MITHSMAPEAAPGDQPNFMTFADRDLRLLSREDSIRFARASGFREVGMSAAEVGILYDRLEAMGSGTIVELGRDYGTSTRLFTQHILKYGGRLDSIDLKHSPGVRESFMSIGFKVSSDLSGDYNLLGYVTGEALNITIRRQHSQKMDIGEVDPFVDFLLIDTEHATWDALGEYARWRMYLRSRAHVAFHDSSLPNVKKAIDIVRELDAERIAEEWVQERPDGFGVYIMRWK